MADKKTDGTFNLEEVKKQYKDLLNDSNFEKLEIELQKPNIFSILGISRKELKHSNILVWLLDPNGSHGLGNKFLIRVLRDLALENNNLEITKIHKLNFNNVEVKREVRYSNEKEGYIDILIDFRDAEDKLVICIENKIDTEDSEEQLTKYQKFIKDDDNFQRYEKVFVYLTPHGKKPVNFKGKEWYTYSYRKNIIEHLENIQNATTNLTIKTYISDYLSTLKKEIMGTQNEAQKLADEIYADNKKLFDFILTNKSKEILKPMWEDDFSWVQEFAEELIGFIRETDEESDYDLHYGDKSAITIRRKTKSYNNIYYVQEKEEPNCILGFTFSTKEDESQIKKFVEKIVENNGKAKCSSTKSYFQIHFANELSPNELKEIHRKRFGI